MVINPKISIPQFFTMLCVNQLVVNVSISPFKSTDGETWDMILSIAVSFVLTLIIFIPTYMNYKQRNDLDIADNILHIFKKFGVVIVFIYALYFLDSTVYALTLFNVFMSNVMSPQAPSLLICVAVSSAAIFGATRGLEGIARASVVIFVFTIISIIFLCVSLFPDVNTLNFTPLLYNGTGQFFRGIEFIISKLTCLPLMALLLPSVKKGNVKAGFMFWIITVYTVFTVLLIIVVSTQGDYLKAHVFPIYSAYSVAELGFLKRLDAVYLGFWTSALFIKFSIMLYAFSFCIKKIFGTKSKNISIFAGGLVVCFLSFFLSSVLNLSFYSINQNILLIVNITIIFILPSVVLLINTVNNRRRLKNEEQN